MNIDKSLIMQLLQSQSHPQADQAATELPDQVDTDDVGHQSLLRRFGIDPSDLTSKLGGLTGGLGNLGKLS